MFFHSSLLSSLLYFVFSLTFLTLSTYFHIFIAFHIFSRVILLLICKVPFTFLNLKMISKRCTILSLVFILKYFYSCCFRTRDNLPATRDTRRLDYPDKKILDRPNKFSTHENKSRKININC